MSRTIRRTGDKKRNKSGRSNFVEDYTFDYVENYLDVDAWSGKPKVKLTGDEFHKEYWRFHRDSKAGYGWGNGTYTRKHFEDRLRMQNKLEIQKFMKNENHVVIPVKPHDLSWED